MSQQREKSTNEYSIAVKLFERCTAQRILLACGRAEFLGVLCIIIQFVYFLFIVQLKVFLLNRFLCWNRSNRFVPLISFE